LKNRLAIPGCRDSSARSTLIAAWRPSSVCSATHTSLMLPAPSGFSIRYAPTRVPTTSRVDGEPAAGSSPCVRHWLNRRLDRSSDR
jgi:hypothetical protein